MLKYNYADSILEWIRKTLFLIHFVKSNWGNIMDTITENTEVELVEEELLIDLGTASEETQGGIFRGFEQEAPFIGYD